MHIDGFPFDIEKIADIIIKEVEELMVEKASVANDFSIVREQFGKVITLKKKLKLETLDIVFIYENKKYDEFLNYNEYREGIAEIYNRINYKLGMSKKIPMFSRGGVKEAPSFHFPAAFNIWFLEVKNFVKSKIKPIVVFDFETGVGSYLNKFNNKEDKELFDIMKYFKIECNSYFSLEKHIEENWNKK